VGLGTVAYDYTGAVVLVTGAARGLGRDMALAFAAAGASVVVSDAPPKNATLGYPTSSQEELLGVAEEIGERSLAVAADVRVEKDVGSLFEQALERFGRIDVLARRDSDGAMDRLRGGTLRHRRSAAARCRVHDQVSAPRAVGSRPRAAARWLRTEVLHFPRRPRS
jgi:hypothetical protein